MAKKNYKKSSVDHHATITNKIIEGLETAEKGGWELPFHRMGKYGTPVNGVTGKHYNGVNRVYLSLIAMEHGSNVFASYKQWKDKGRQVDAGSKGYPVSFYKPLEVEDRDNPEGEMKKIPIFSFSTVFNEAQLADYVAPTVPEGSEKIGSVDAADQLIKVLSPQMGEAGSAFYRSREDKIYLPPKQNFKSTEGYYATLLHELVHWTGHEKRCNRKLRNRFGSPDYAREELIAEIGCTFLSHDLGITPELREDHVQYISSWLEILRDDTKAIFKASGMAQKAVDWIDKQSVVQEAELSAA